MHNKYVAYGKHNNTVHNIKEYGNICCYQNQKH